MKLRSKLAHIFISTLIIPSLFLPILSSQETGKKSPCLIARSFFNLYFDKNFISQPQIKKIIRWVEISWASYLKHSYKNPLAEGEKIDIYFRGSFLLTNYSDFDSKPYRIYISSHLAMAEEQTSHDKTLIAHEIFHLFQSAYYWPKSETRRASEWLFEGTALSAAAMIMNSKDILHSFPYQSDRSLFENDYGAAWFWQFIEKNYGHDFMRRIWESLSADKPTNENELILSLDKTFINCIRKHLAEVVRMFSDYRKNLSREKDSY